MKGWILCCCFFWHIHAFSSPAVVGNGVLDTVPVYDTLASPPASADLVFSNNTFTMETIREPTVLLKLETISLLMQAYRQCGKFSPDGTPSKS
jgi:hypothetical protein